MGKKKESSKWKNLIEKKYSIEIRNLVLLVLGLLFAGSLATFIDPNTLWLFLAFLLVLIFLRFQGAFFQGEKKE